VRCDQARDDAAYVLGALSAAERAAFERHLAGCVSCRDSVAELAVLPGLLARLDVATAEALLDPSVETASDFAEVETAGRPDAGSVRLPRLLRAADDIRRRERRRRRWRTAVAGLAVACAAGLAGFAVAAVDRPAPSDRPVAMTSMVPTPAGAQRPVTAEVALTETAGGTRVWMHCTYATIGGYQQPYTLRLVGFGRDGTTEQVASWRAEPGDDLSIDGVVRYDRGELVRVELQADDGVPLLVYRVT